MVVIVGELDFEMGFIRVFGPKHVVESHQIGVALGFEFLRPVIRRRHSLGTGSHQGGDVDVSLSDPEIESVFTGAALFSQRLR